MHQDEQRGAALSSSTAQEQPVLPDWAGACTTNLMPFLVDPLEVPAWCPEELAGAEQVVFLVVDGLGWEQFRERPEVAPVMSAMAGVPITTIAPSTTATALTSISTALPPGEHGLVGYRISVEGEILNALRWATPRGDARGSIPPEEFSLGTPFEGERPPVVTRAEFGDTGFTRAHLRGCRFVPYRMASTLCTEVSRLVRAREPFVYAYYEGIDKVSHEYGLGEHYDAELAAVDRIVGELIEALPADAALVVTSDHGQVEVGDRVIAPAPGVLAQVDHQSGEGRFRWFHAVAGAEKDLLEAATEAHGDTAWVVSRDQVVDEGWFGPKVTAAAYDRLGDVALVAREPVAYDDPEDTGPFHLIGRHGSLTAAEMYVPLLVARR